MAAAQKEFPSLVGHLLFGVGTALVFVLLHGPGEAGRARQPIGAGALARGLAAGALAALALGAVLGTAPRRWPPGRPLGSSRRACRHGPTRNRGRPGPRAGLQVRGLDRGGADRAAHAGRRGAALVAGRGPRQLPGLPGWLLLGALAAVAHTLLDRVAPLLSSEHLRAYRGTGRRRGWPRPCVGRWPGCWAAP